MRVLESRFLRGPNIHRMTPCMVSLLDLEDHRPVNFLGLQGEAPVVLRELLLCGDTPACIDAAELAGLLARLMFAVQARAGRPATFCEAVGHAPSAAGHYRLLCGFQHEGVAAEALRLSVECINALIAHQPFDIEARLAGMRARAAASPIGTAAQANNHRGIPVVAVTGTNGKTTTTQLIAHVLRACGVRTGTTTTQGIFIDGHCVETGDCSGYRSARRVLSDPGVQVATLESARGGILKRGLAFDHCDVGVVLNVSSDHLGIDGIETLHDLAHVKGLVARCARGAAVLNADDALCVAMRETLAPDCRPVFFSMHPRNPVLVDHLRAGGAGACLDDEGWLLWCSAADRSRVVRAADLPITLHGHARHNTANALAALASLRCMGYETDAIAQSLMGFVSDAKSNPLRGNQFDVDGVKLIVDYAHNVVAYRALCEMARSMHQGAARLLGVVTSPGDRRSEDLYETGQVFGIGFDELVVYEQDPRGRGAGATTHEILRGARNAAPGKPLHGEPRIRHALRLGLAAARPGDMLVFTCAGTFDDLVEGIRFKNPAAAERIAREVSHITPCAQPTGAW